MAVLYRNLCYSEACYNEVELYTILAVINSIKALIRLCGRERCYEHLMA